MNMDTLKNVSKGDLKVPHGKAKADDWEYIQYMLSNSPFKKSVDGRYGRIRRHPQERRTNSRGINKR